MFWSHLHPALIHFVLGLGILLLLWDLWGLTRAPEPQDSGSLLGKALEGWMALVLLGVGTGWIALTHDEVMQHHGAPLRMGELHGRLGVLILVLTTFRVLGGPFPKPPAKRLFLMGVDLGLVGLLLGTGLLGEWLVFHQGLGLSGVTF